MYNKGSEIREQAAQGGDRSPSLETFKVRLQDSEKPEAVEYVPASFRGVGPDDP